MSKKAVFGLANNETQVRKIVEDLRGLGFTDNNISVLYPDMSTGAAGLGHEKGSKAPEGAVAGVGTGGAIGVTLGWLAGIGMLAIPGVGPFIAAGPILAALSGAAVGATVGGLAGGLVGMGIPEYEAKLYENKLKAGKILISVHTEDSKERDRAQDLLKADGAEDIGVTAEAVAKS